MNGKAFLNLRRAQRILFFGAPCFVALLSLLIGKKTGWDFYNYHWYNPYAFLHDRFDFDIAVGHHATYYNPLSDLPLYWIASLGPSWLGGLFSGAMAGVVVSLIGVLAYQVLSVEQKKYRTATAALIAIASIFGAGAFQEIGDPANDIPAAIGVVAALILIVRVYGRVGNGSFDMGERSRSETTLFIGAGLLVGAAVALKLTIAVYAVGIAGALAIIGNRQASRSPSMVALAFHHLSRSIWFSLGVVLGLLIVGGSWMHTLWSYSGNPVFPYFNDLVQSPLLAPESHRDLNFRPHGFFNQLLFPFHFTINSRVASESVFRDAHILALYLLLPITAILRIAVVGSKPVLSLATKFLFAFAAIAYLAWMTVFGIYRYLIPLEMLASLLIVLAILSWPIGARWRIGIAVAVLVVAQLLVRIDISDRQSWEGKYIEVTVPALPNPERTLVLMTGKAPMSYVIPSFPAPIPFLRIDGWLVTSDDREHGLARSMRQRINSHAGDLLVLFDPLERNSALAALDNYALWMNEPCQQVTSNIDKPLQLCAVSKR
jgi:hypothetical protein